MCHLFLRMNIRSLSLKLIIIYLSASTKTNTPQMGSSNESDEKKNIHTSFSYCLPQFLFPLSWLPFYLPPPAWSPSSPCGNDFRSGLLSLAHRQCKDQTPAADQSFRVHSQLCQSLPSSQRPPSFLSGPCCPCSPGTASSTDRASTAGTYSYHSCTTSFRPGNSLDSSGTVST